MDHSIRLPLYERVDLMFIRLTRKHNATGYGNDIYINPTQISDICVAIRYDQGWDNTTIVSLRNQNEYHVKESPELIMAMTESIKSSENQKTS